mgnify:CR=1 FL=1
MTKTYSVPEFKQRLAKRIRELVDIAAADIQDLVKRENFAKSIMGSAHFEPGVHEPPQVGVPEHLEPGQDEQVQMDAPPAPGVAAPSPTQGGIGIPPAELQASQHSADLGSGPCPLCGQPDQPGSCRCLDNMILGKSDGVGPGMMAGPAGNAGDPATAPMALSEEMCKNCSKMHKAGECGMTKDELNPGENGNPSKQQPTPWVASKNQPPDKGGKKVKSGDDNEVEKGKLDKAAVPEAKPPSGKVPGQGAAPMASNISKPVVAPKAATPKSPGAAPVVKEEALGKAVLPAAAKQHMAVDASRGAAGAANPSTSAVMAPGSAKTLTHPDNLSVAAGHAAALGGAFQPQGPISSRHSLAPKAGPKKTGVHGPALKPQPVQMRQPAPAAVAPAVAKTSPFGKSERCAFCNKAEHPGDCRSK